MREVATLLLVPLIMIGGAGVWSLLLWSIGCLSGWRSLAEQYPPAPKPTGDFWWLETLSMNGVNYNGMVNLRFTERGLHVSAFPLFRPGHPPMLRPWNAFSPIRDEPVLWFSNYRTDIKAADGGGVTLTLHRRLAVEVGNYLSSAEHAC